MNNHPINLTVRFLLELSALGALGAWGWQRGEGGWRWVLMLLLPLLAAALWGTFRVPGDPGPAPVAVPGLLRLALEGIFFAAAIWALFDLQATRLGWTMAVVVVLHYLVSYDRVWALLGK